MGRHNSVVLLLSFGVFAAACAGSPEADTESDSPVAVEADGTDICVEIGQDISGFIDLMSYVADTADTSTGVNEADMILRGLHERAQASGNQGVADDITGHIARIDQLADTYEARSGWISDASLIVTDVAMDCEPTDEDRSQDRQEWLDESG